MSMVVVYITFREGGNLITVRVQLPCSLVPLLSHGEDSFVRYVSSILYRDPERIDPSTLKIRPAVQDL